MPKAKQADYASINAAAQTNYTQIKGLGLGINTGTELSRKVEWSYTERYETGGRAAEYLREKIENMTTLVEEVEKIDPKKRTPDQNTQLALAKSELSTIATKLENLQKAKDLSPKMAHEALQARRAVNSTGNFRRREETAEELTQEGDDPGENARIIRGAYQCFLLYNLNIFADQHKDMLAAPTGIPFTSLKYGYNGVSSGPGLGDIQTPGYWSKHSYPRILLVDENTDGSEVISRLNIRKGDTAFSRIKTHEYAQLMPLLRLYKVYRPHEGNDRLVEFEFGNKKELDGISKKLTITDPGDREREIFSRGVSAGVKSFDWTYLGTDPYTATKDIKATLTLVFQDFSALLKERSGLDLFNSPKMASYKYVDLIVNPDCRNPGNNIHGQVYSPECYEIRADVGYHNPGTNLSDEIRDSIACQKRTLYLVPTKHTFNIRDDGSYELVVELRGRLEMMMRDKIFNVLLPGGGFDSSMEPQAGLDRLDMRIQKIRSRSKLTPKDKKDIKTLEVLRSDGMAQYKQYAFAGMMDRLETAGMIHRHTMTDTEWTTFTQWTTSGDPNLPPQISTAPFLNQGAGVDIVDDDATVSADRMDQLLEAQAVRSRDQVINNSKYVDYIYLGDLLAVVTDSVLGEHAYEGSMTEMLGWKSKINNIIASLGLDPLFEDDHVAGGSIQSVELGGSPSTVIGLTGWPVRRSQSAMLAIQDKFRIILGNITVSLPGAHGTTHTVNLAHVPISIEAFYGFLADNVLAKDRLYYSYFRFIDDLLADLVTGMLSSDCFNGLIKFGVKAQTQNINSLKEISPNIYTNTGKYKTLKVGNITEQDPAFTGCLEDSFIGKDPYEYLVISAQNVGSSNYNGQVAADRARGVLHFNFGEDRGLLKTAKLQKTDAEFLPEARYAAEGDFVFNQLSSVYNADFNMVGNTLFIPGQYLYFDTVPLGAGEPFHYKELSSGKIERSWANLMGLGGYHIITEIASSISPGKYTTTVKARYESGGSLPEDGT